MTWVFDSGVYKVDTGVLASDSRCSSRGGSRITGRGSGWVGSLRLVKRRDEAVTKLISMAFFGPILNGQIGLKEWKSDIYNALHLEDSDWLVRTDILFFFAFY